MALAEGGAVRGEVRLGPVDGHSKRLMPSIAFLLQGLGLAPGQIDGYAVAAGPGSFTGLRVGIGTVQGLALAADRPCAAVSALDALAARAHGASDCVVAVMEAHNETMPGSGGVNSCRNIANTDMPSLHAYLVAADFPPNSRPKDAFIGAIERIRTNNGKQVFLNGRIFDDRMHFQLNCSQADLKTGINWDTVEGARDDMVTAEQVRQIVKEELAAFLETPVWSTGHGTPPGPNQPLKKVLSRDYRNINELIDAHRDKKLGVPVTQATISSADKDDIVNRLLAKLNLVQK